MLKKIEQKIKYLKEDIHKMIEEKNNLLDPEVIRVSQELDIVLNQYNTYLNRKEV